MKKVLTIVLLLPLALFAESKEKRILSCRFIPVNQKPTEPWYAHGEGGEYVPVIVSSDFIAAPVKIDGHDGISLYRKVETPPAKKEDKPKIEYLPVFTCPASEGRGQLVMAFNKGESKWSAQSYSDSEAGFANGTSWVFNLADADLGFDYGGVHLEVPKGGFGKLAKPGKIIDGGVSVTLSEKTPSGWKKFFQSVWPYDVGSRQLLFAYRDPRSKRMALRGIDDVRAPEEVPVADKKKSRSAVSK